MVGDLYIIRLSDWSRNLFSWKKARVSLNSHVFANKDFQGNIPLRLILQKQYHHMCKKKELRRTSFTLITFSLFSEVIALTLSKINSITKLLIISI